MMPEIQRQRCEIFSRVVGYLRPIRNWNEGKREEFKMRTLYTIDGKAMNNQGERNHVNNNIKNVKNNSNQN